MSLQSVVLYAREYMQRLLPQYVEVLRELCSIDSISYYKPGLDEMVTVLSAYMRDLGMDITVFKQEQWGNDLLGTIRGEGDGKVAIVGHMDTVYPVGTAAARPLRVEGNTVYGPGVSDMKGCILSAIYAIKALLAQGYQSFGEIRFLCVSDEEISNRHSEDLIFRVAQDCQAALVLEAASANGDIVSARKGTVHYKLRVQGRAAHAGVEPEKGRNAIVELAHQIALIDSLNGWCEGLSISACLTSGGTAENMIPDYAEAILDMRFVQHEDRVMAEKRLHRMVQEHLVPDVEVILQPLRSHYPPMVPTSESMKLVSVAQELANVIGFPLNHMLRGGGSDACNTSRYGVPTLDGLGPIGGLDHSPNEYLLLDSVPSRTALLAGLIATIRDQAANKGFTKSHLGV
jgi:glutamate carboxypeptidase